MDIYPALASLSFVMTEVSIFAALQGPFQQLVDFGLSCDLIHVFQPIQTSFTGQRFASVFLRTSLRSGTLDLGGILPAAGRIRDFHPLDRALVGHTKDPGSAFEPGFFCLW